MCVCECVRLTRRSGKGLARDSCSSHVLKPICTLTCGCWRKINPSPTSQNNNICAVPVIIAGTRPFSGLLALGSLSLPGPLQPSVPEAHVPGLTACLLREVFPDGSCLHSGQDSVRPHCPFLPWTSVTQGAVFSLYACD